MSAARMKVKRTVEIDVQGLGERIKAAREADERSLEKICGEVGISRVYWYDIEAERIRGSLPEDTLRRIENVLGKEFDVEFD